MPALTPGRLAIVHALPALLIAVAITVASTFVAAPARAVAPAAPTGCTTTLVNNASTSSTVAIPDGTGTAISRTISLPSSTGLHVWDADVTVDILHTRSSDLQLSLQHGSTVVMLTSGNGGDNNDVFDGTVWDDESANPVATYPYVDSVSASDLRPSGALAGFRGHALSGSWTLTVKDLVAGEVGDLDGWQIAVTTCADPQNTASPTIAGVAQRGATLTSTTGTWTRPDAAFTYKWRRCSDDACTTRITQSTTSPTYTPDSFDVGHRMVLEVAASADGSTGTFVSSAPTPPVADVVASDRPVVSGSATVGSHLTSTTGTWPIAASVGIDWQRCSAAGDGCTLASTSTTYTVVAADVGKTLRSVASLSITGTNPVAYSDVTAVVPAPPVPPVVDRTRPVISAVVKLGRLGAALKQGLLATITTSEPGSAKVVVSIAPTLAKQLKVPVVLGTRTVPVAAAGAVPVRVVIPAKVRKKLATLRSLKVTVTITIADASNNRSTTVKVVTLKK